MYHRGKMPRYRVLEGSVCTGASAIGRDLPKSVRLHQLPQWGTGVAKTTNWRLGKRNLIPQATNAEVVEPNHLSEGSDEGKTNDREHSPQDETQGIHREYRCS